MYTHQQGEFFSRPVGDELSQIKFIFLTEGQTPLLESRRKIKRESTLHEV